MSDSKTAIVSSKPTFNFKGHTVRAMVRDGEPWFVASDVAKALKFQDVAKAAHTLPEKNKLTYTARTLKGEQQITMISEGGLYRMVLRSRKPLAVAFSDWVIDEVLPCMRKLGTDKKSAPPNSQASEYQRISPAQVQELKELVDAIANAGIKQHSEAWACLQNKFKVNSYLQLDTTQYGEARQYLIAQLPNGYPGEVDKEIPKPAAVPERTSYTVPSKAAFEAATRAAAQVQRAVFETVMDGGDDWKHQRLLLTLINDGSAVVPADVQFIESDSFVTTWPRLTDSIRQNKYPQSAKEMLDMATACLQRLHVVSE